MFMSTSGVELARPLVFYFSFQAMLKSLYKGHFEIDVHIIICNLARVWITKRETKSNVDARWIHAYTKHIMLQACRGRSMG